MPVTFSPIGLLHAILTVAQCGPLYSDGVLPVPTMEMVRAQFHYPGSATQQTEELLIEPSMRDDPRLNARKKLTAEKREKFNQLGEKINQKLEKFQDLLRDKHSTASSL